VIKPNTGSWFLAAVTGHLDLFHFLNMKNFTCTLLSLLLASLSGLSSPPLDPVTNNFKIHRISGTHCISSIDPSTDTVKSKPHTDELTRSELISKNRMALLDNLIAGKTEKVIRLNYFLTNTLSDVHYFALYPVEEFLIQYQTGQFKAVLRSVVNFDSTRMSMRTKIPPANDDLDNKLHELTANIYTIILDSIQRSLIPGEDKEFLSLLLASLCADEKKFSQDTLNLMADHFLARFPRSNYSLFTRQYLRFEYIPANWGYAFELFSGYGFLTPQLSEHFTNYIPLGFSIDVYFRNFVLFLRAYAGFSYTRHEFGTGNDVWSEHSQVRVFLPEASVGYIFHNDKYFRLAPFVGIGSCDIGPTSYDKKNNSALEKYELSFTTTYIAGFNTEFKLGKLRSEMTAKGKKQSFIFIRLRYTYAHPMFWKYYEGYGGSLNCITLGFGMMTRKIKRVY